MRINFLSLRWTAVLVGAFMPAFTQAADFSFDNLKLSDYDALVKEFSADSTYTSVTPASSLGGLWGFEFGVVANTIKASDTQALILRNNASADFNGKLYNAGGLVRIGLPFGLTGEGMYIPKIKAGGVKIGRWAMAAEWTLTDSVLEDLPVNIALKGFYTKTTLSYAQTINNASTANLPVNGNITFDDSLWGLQALVSHKIFIFEPYAGIGWTKAKGKLTVDATGTTSLFNIGDFGATQSATSTPSSAQLMAGLDLRLAFFTVGAEYDRVFNKSVYAGRVSFRF